MNWYVLHVRTGKEQEVKNELKRQGFGAAAPTELVTERKGGKWREQLKILLPGYVFVKLQLTEEEFYAVRDIPGVIHFLGVGSPEAIRENEEEYLLWVANDDRPLGSSDILLQEGNAVTVISGPLHGREGIIVRLNRRQRRAVIAITFGGHRQEFSLSANFLRPFEEGDA